MADLSDQTRPRKVRQFQFGDNSWRSLDLRRRSEASIRESREKKEAEGRRRINSDNKNERDIQSVRSIIRASSPPLMATTISSRRFYFRRSPRKRPWATSVPSFQPVERSIYLSTWFSSSTHPLCPSTRYARI